VIEPISDESARHIAKLPEQVQQRLRIITE